jgi:hypothetical protein
MHVGKILAVFVIVFGFVAGPATAQILTGTVTGTVKNTFGQTIGNDEANCTGCTFTTSPETLISNNTTSTSYVAVASPANP